MSNAYMQLKFESTPGFEGSTDTLSTKTIFPPLIGAGFSLNPQHLDRDDEARGTDDASAVVSEMFDPSWTLETRMYPDLVGFLLKGLLGAPVTTAGDGIITDPDAATIPVGAYRHVWTAPFGPAGPSPQTMQGVFGYKDQGVWWRVKGMAIESLEITTPTQGGTRLQINGQATFAQRISDPSLVPAPESIATRPFLRSGLTLPTWLSNTGVTEDYSTTISNSIEPYHSLGSASKYPDLMEKGEGLIVCTGSVPKRRLAVADMDALRDATGFAATAKWLNESSIGVTASKYALWQAMSNCQYVDGNPGDLSNARRIGADLSFKATNAGAASVVYTLVNATSAYS
ncbi:phage tail tube protein [Paraconexibacter algicola]|uniref:Uncharacterized protein n=1 Tax=Paraconexibacter algicola TaxID=2133960 RepID=A0A2T4UE15_9ACTN|nr:phage tail tube protein [Paraconexibacter algicola]PTL55754.1 hypothetical protein C7Y72_19180 [Paraconexibacter algicola]